MGGFGFVRVVWVGGYWSLARARNRKRVDSESEAIASTLRTRRLGLILAGATAVGATSWAAVQGWRGMARAESLRIQAIRFEGTAHAADDDLLGLSTVRPGDHLLLSDLDAMRAALARHPWVKSVRTRRTWPPAVVVTVQERTAAALVDLGGLYLVEDDGNVFKRAEAGDGLDLPVITGISRNDYVQRRAAVEPLLRGALAVARSWREGGRDGKARLSEIHVDGDGTTLYVGEQGTQVRLGSGDLPAKLQRLDQMLAVLRTEGKAAEVLHLDNRVHPSWVTVRLASTEQVKGGGR